MITLNLFLYYIAIGVVVATVVTRQQDLDHPAMIPISIGFWPFVLVGLLVMWVIKPTEKG